MIKYTSNSFLATLISFSNEVGNLCSSIGEIDYLLATHYSSTAAAAQIFKVVILPICTTALQKKYSPTLTKQSFAQDMTTTVIDYQP